MFNWFGFYLPDSLSSSFSYNLICLISFEGISYHFPSHSVTFQAQSCVKFTCHHIFIYLLFSLHLIYLILSHFICVCIISPWWLHLITSNVHLSLPHLYYVCPPIQNLFKFSFSNNLISLYHLIPSLLTLIQSTVYLTLLCFSSLYLPIGVLWTFFNCYFHFVSYISTCLIAYPLIHYTVLGWFLNFIPSHRLIFALFSSFDPNTNATNSHLISYISYISSCLICCHINTLLLPNFHHLFSSWCHPSPAHDFILIFLVHVQHQCLILL